MNIRKTSLIFLIAIILVISILIFVRKTFIAGPPQIPAPMMPREIGEVMTEPSTDYALPVNTTPTVREIEADIKNTEKRRQDLENKRNEIQSEKMKGARQLSSQEAQSSKETSSLPSREPSIAPTEEERKEIQSKGIITY